MIKMLNMRSAFAFLLASLIFCLVFTTPPVKGERDESHYVDLLLAYDKSFEAFMRDEHNITNYSDRTKQIVHLASTPFLNQFNIHFDVTTGPYASYFDNPSPAQSCECMYGPPDENYQGSNARMVWNYYSRCQCDGLSHSQHHSNGTFYTSATNQLATSQGSAFDDVGVIIGHTICYTNNEYIIAGLGRINQPGFVFDGKSGFVSSETYPEQFFNLLYSKFLFSHEISHNFNVTDGYNSNTHCTIDDPCIMNHGFTSIVYVNDVWCYRCHNDFNPAKFD